MRQYLERLGAETLQFIQWLGALHLFIYAILTAPYKLRNAYHLLMQQLYFIGVLSLPIIIIAGLFVGMVIGLQGYYTLVDFGAEDSLGVLVALSLMRELGPVMTAILFAGRAGSALATEIGLMKTTQQLDALEVMAVDPMRRIFRPRLAATLIIVPALNMIFIASGLIGAWFISAKILGVDSNSFFSQMQTTVSWQADVINGVIKSFVFGLTVGVLALFFGYTSKPTAAGTSLATTKTVVYGSLVTLGLDFILTAIMF